MSGRVSYLGGIVKDGLVLDLDAGKLDSYNRLGTTWNDISGNRNNGTLTNGGDGGFATLTGRFMTNLIPSLIKDTRKGDRSHSKSLRRCIRNLVPNSTSTSSSQRQPKWGSRLFLIIREYL